jgi:hypothetical protein
MRKSVLMVYQFDVLYAVFLKLVWLAVMAIKSTVFYVSLKELIKENWATLECF